MKVIPFLLTGLIMIFLACGCQNHSLPPGVVATVNGKPIYLHSLQTLLDCRAASTGIDPRPSLEEMQKTYVSALKVLITHALVREELKAKGLKIEDEIYNDYINHISADYGEENLKKFLEDSYIREDDWRDLIADFIALEIFKNQILRPGIKIDKEEISAWHKKHANELALPDTAKICYLTATDSQVITDWCEDLNKKIIPENDMIQCADVPAQDLPKEWQPELNNLKPYACAKLKKTGDLWQSIALIERKSKKKPSIGEVYALIENILLEQKQHEAFDRWLKDKISRSKILVTPEFNNCLSKFSSDEDFTPLEYEIPLKDKIPPKEPEGD